MATMGHTCSMQQAPSVLRPGLRTYKPRRSRITPRQRRALDTPGPPLLPVNELSDAWQPGLPVVLDIGFGSAEQVVDLAQCFPGQMIVAVDVYTPGVGDLVDRCRQNAITNVRVLEGDALELMPGLPGTLIGVRSFFPDPWPKARHHKRRLVQPAVIDAVCASVDVGGFWHIATDWQQYAESILDLLSEDSRWRGGVIERPEWRPVTHFEKRAERDGRPVVDMWFERT